MRSYRPVSQINSVGATPYVSSFFEGFPPYANPLHKGLDAISKGLPDLLLVVFLFNDNRDLMCFQRLLMMWKAMRVSWPMLFSSNISKSKIVGD